MISCPRNHTSVLIYLIFILLGTAKIPHFLWHVVARVEVGSSTDNRMTESMRKISDVCVLVIPLNSNRTHQTADPRDGKRVENYGTSLVCISTIDH